jgi:copper chaperone CopZ
MNISNPETTMRTIPYHLALPMLLFFSSCSAQVKNARTVTVHVNGDCGMCEKTIESAAFVKGEAEADWDVDAKTARITFDSTRTSLDAVLQRIAQAGYDTERFLAPDAAYAALPGCCQYERTDKHAAVNGDGHVHAEGGGHAGTSMTEHIEGGNVQATTKEADQLTPLFDAYFGLKDALVASDAAAASKEADMLADAWHAVQMERMTPEVHVVWMKVMEQIEQNAHKIVASKDLGAQRKLFIPISDAMIALVKVAPRPQPVYADHCPMFEGGADWLSQEKGIKNPFYGAMMLTCGSVKETITK